MTLSISAPRAESMITGAWRVARCFKARRISNPFFFGRAGIYFIVWAGLSWLLYKNSVKGDSATDESAQKKVVKAELAAAKKSYGPAIKQYQTALKKLMPMQKSDFAGLFREMKGYPVTIRTLDPPLHEFLPHSEEDLKAVAEATGLDAAKLLRRAKELRETNPMLGHRGCRLGVSYPEIYEMQVRAIVEAGLDVAASGRPAPKLEIMHPLVAKGEEMNFLRGLTDRTVKQVCEERGQTIESSVGAMVELPRAALRAGELAVSAEFFSFGTNDLTQTTFGISRDDSGRFLNAYIDKGIFEKDPFVSIDVDGVGDLIRIATERGRAVRPDVKLGICGEHGGDPASIAFCEEVGLDYVSCSAYRVPIARLAAAQAALKAKG